VNAERTRQPGESCSTCRHWARPQLDGPVHVDPTPCCVSPRNVLLLTEAVQGQSRLCTAADDWCPGWAAR
jgi:hypothetical protein